MYGVLIGLRVVGYLYDHEEQSSLSRGLPSRSISGLALISGLVTTQFPTSLAMLFSAFIHHELPSTTVSDSSQLRFPRFSEACEILPICDPCNCLTNGYRY